ncbi:MAG: helix-turn-helix transcriptional regulator [Chloroflexi bacterium]|nr:helix-turn-helix transcriptional regulator [Chloroflexota bacterium]MBI3733759.1 helix-turn-helix transcriptional regulator [Chloroflexota bacterium]
MTFQRKRRANNLNRFIRERIRQARLDRELSQEHLARSLEKTRVAVSDLERGRVCPNAADLAVIADALQKPITYFYPPDANSYDIAGLTSKEKELIHFFRQLGHDALEDVTLKQVRTLADAAIGQSAEENGHDGEGRKARAKR